MIRTLLFSDEPILAKGLEAILVSVEGFQLTGVCSNTAKLKEILESGEPDILLIDLTSDVTFSILSELKKASLNAKIVLWVHSISTELALQAMQEQVSDYLNRDQLERLGRAVAQALEQRRLRQAHQRAEEVSPQHQQAGGEHHAL